MRDGPVRRLFRIFDRPPSSRAAVELEIVHHIEERAEALMASEGLSREEALAEARRRFGDVRRLRSEMEQGERRHRRAQRQSEILSQTFADARFALRGLRKSPGLAAVVVGTLTLGIGLNTAIFSVVKDVLLEPLPYPDAERLVWGVGAFSGSPQAAVSPPDYLDYREQATSFEYLGGRRGIGSYALTGLGQPEIVRGQQVTAEFFEALGGVPVLGRSFDPRDERQISQIVILGHGFWQDRFGGGADVLGRTLVLDGEPHEVVGVMPEGFQLFSEPDFWSPIPLYSEANLVRRFHNLRLVGKRREGVSIEQAQAELDVIAARLEREYPDSNATWRLPIVPLEQVVVGTTVRASLLILWGAVGMILLIVCANVANLLLARGASRRSELAVRAALGASRTRILRLLFTENMSLAMLGCAAGIGLAVLSIRLLKALDPGTLPRLDEVGLDAGVLAFALAVSILTGLIFGLLPSLAASRPDLSRTLKTGGRGRVGGRVRGTLVVAEVALSFVVLIGAGLLIQSFTRLLAVDPGFEPEGTIIANVSLPAARYPTDAARVSFFTRLRDRLEAIPGVERAATGSYLPLLGGGNDTYVGVPGRLELGTDLQFNSQFRVVSRNFFEVMGIPLLRGRPFDAGDRAGGAPVVIIDETFARTIFPEESPLGQTLQIDLGEAYEAEVVGVVGAVTHYSLAGAPINHLYLPYDQLPIHPYLTAILRTSVDPAILLDEVPAAVAEVDPLQPVDGLSTYGRVVSRGVAQPRFQALLLGGFGAVALTLAIVGLYGVLSYAVAQRAREVGLRMALGASRGDVVRLIVGRGAWLMLGGLGIGAAAALALTRYMSSILYQVTATDLVTFLGAAGLLAVTSLAASYLPARRAARVDATVTLREQ